MAEITTSPDFSAEQRVAFNAKLDDRLRLRRTTGWQSLVAGAALGVMALLFFAKGEQRTTVPQASAPIAAVHAPAATTEEVSAEEALLALGSESSVDRDTSLPDDYVAIESLFLGS